MNTSSANRKYQATHPWNSKARQESSGNHIDSLSHAEEPAAARQSASLGNEKTQAPKTSTESSSSSSYSCESSNYVNCRGNQQYNPRHECTRIILPFWSVMSLMFCSFGFAVAISAFADLVASAGIELPSSDTLLTAPTRSIPSEQHGQRINHHNIPLAALGSDSTIIELAPEALHSTLNMRTEFGARQVTPWPTASHPPPGDPSVLDTIIFLASTTSSNPPPPSSLTTATPSPSPPPVDPIPDLPRPDEKPYLLTDFEYETMWNPDYNTLRLGVLLPFSTKPTERQALMVRKTMSAIRLAVNDANQQRLIPGLNLTLVVRDSQDPNLIASNGGAAAITAAGSLLSVKVSGVIGDIRSDMTRYEALITSSVQIPQCSFAAANTILSDASLYPYFFRTIPTTIMHLDAIMDVVRAAGWNRISLIYDIETIGWAGREYFAAKAHKMGIYILAFQPLTTPGIPLDESFEFVKSRIHATQSRIQVLIATGSIQETFLTAMKNAGLFGPDYAWVTMNDISRQLEKQEGFKEYDGLMMVDNGWELNGYEPFENFLSEWTTLNLTDYPGAGDPELNNNEGMAYSCVMMLAQAYGRLVNDTIPADEHSERRELFLRNLKEGEHTEEIRMQNYFSNTTYSGPSGPITLDQNGDRKEGYFIALNMRDGRSVTFGIIFSGNFSSIRIPHFKDGHPWYPRDAPPWAIQNPKWDSSSGIIFAVLCLTGFIMTFVATILVLYFRHHIVIKATRSLTIKNYRVYRIFNSVTAANQSSFQTRKLIWYLVAFVLLAVLPIIVQVIVDPPVPTVINIRSYQWMRCRGLHPTFWWQITAAMFPTLLILFGVFLAFKTRNVVFLWNEARQISLVLYNVLFFTIIIAIAQAFPPEIYVATFYITIMGTYFIAMLALGVLFVPKFWHIYKSHRKYYTNQTQDQVGTMGGGYGGGEGGMDTAEGLARLPGDPGGSQGATTTLVIPDQDVPGMVDGAKAQGGVLNPITAEEVPSPIIGSNSHTALQRILSTDSAGSRRSRRSAQRIEANPLGKWTKDKVSHKGTVPVTETFSETLPEVNGGEDHAPGNGKALDEKTQGRVEFDLEANTEGARKGDVHGTVDAEPMRTQFVHDRTFGISNSGAQRVSINGKPSSYLMMTMAQLRSETEPTLRVTTCHSGTLFIRFTTQKRLDGWMSLFSEEDVQELSGCSNFASLAGSSVTGLPSFALAERGCLDHNPHGLGMLGPGMSLSSEMNEFQEQVRQQQQQHGFGFDFQQHPSQRLGSSHDLLASNGSAALVSMMPSPDQEQRPESSQKRHSWTARLSLSHPIGQLRNRKDSLKSTSGETGEDLSTKNTERIRAGDEWTSTDSSMTTAVPKGVRKSHMLKENVLEDDGEDDDMEALELSTKLANERIVKGKDAVLPDSPVSVSHSDLPISSITPDAPEGSRDESDNTLTLDTPSPQIYVSAPTSPLAPGEISMIGNPVSKTKVTPEASSTGTSISNTHPAGITCLPLSLASNQPSSTHATTQRKMIVRPLPPDDESGDAFYEDAILSDSDEPVKPKITDMDLHPSREFSKHAKHQHNMATLLSLPQIDSFPRTRKRPQASKVQDPKKQPSAIPASVPQRHGQKSNSTAAPKPQRQAKFPIVPQLEPRPISPGLARSLHSISQADDLDMDDDAEDELYDPEFGIGPASGHSRRRRRNWFRLPGMSNSLASSTHAVIPSADVISAAAKAVSQGWSESDALQMAMNKSRLNTSSLAPGSGGLSPSSSRQPGTRQQTDLRQSAMASGSSTASRHVSTRDADLNTSRRSSFHSLRRSELPLLSPTTHGGAAAEQRPPTPRPRLDKHAMRLIATSRSTISGAASLMLRRDSSTGQVLAPAIAAPTAPPSESSVDGGLDDTLVAPLAMYATENQQNT
ncbi:hypothetical protein BG006_005252 [Podila minutissima]|uniref:G-protein coupled receptors family 3 profile domain-containing protein n=1 Tax=Podila minutissima TaxID=64525 RepID=A0A9P5VMF0_9FUNG|nr:hypothetical protein BG006_005252 [Podila minutissima]